MKRKCPRCHGTGQMEIGEVCYQPLRAPCTCCAGGGAIEEPDKCRACVQDHTDYVDCGREAVRGGYCLEHAGEEAEVSRAKIARLEKELVVERQRLFLLTSESGRMEARSS